jgi:hypothetical protein
MGGGDSYIGEWYFGVLVNGILVIDLLERDFR